MNLSFKMWIIYRNEDSSAVQLNYFLFLSSPARTILIQWLRVGLKSKSCTEMEMGISGKRPVEKCFWEKTSGEMFLFVLRPELFLGRASGSL